MKKKKRNSKKICQNPITSKIKQNNAEGVKGIINLIEADIRNRGLSNGDKYLYAKDVAKMFNVNHMKVQRAMKIMADMGKLVRRPREGTFVGPKLKNGYLQNSNSIQSVHIMMAMDYRLNTGISENIFLESVNELLPGTAIQVHYVPDTNSLGYTKHIVNQIETGGAREVLIFIRSSEKVQRYIQDKNLIAGILGSVYTGITKLPWVDIDPALEGRLMAEYAVKKEIKQFVLLMYHNWRKGDNDLLNSIISVLGRAGLQMDNIYVHSMPDDINFIVEDVRTILADKTLPIAVFCRSETHVQAVVQAAGLLKLRIGKDICLISAAHVNIDNMKNYVHIEPEYSIQEQFKILLNLIIDNISTKKTNKSGKKISVTLKVCGFALLAVSLLLVLTTYRSV